jgi:hypothetical protein
VLFVVAGAVVVVAAVIVVVTVSPHCFLLSLGHVAIDHLQTNQTTNKPNKPNVSRVDVLIA